MTERPETEKATTGSKLLADLFAQEPKDSYQPNGLPPIDEKLHSSEVIASLQKRALEL